MKGSLPYLDTLNAFRHVINVKRAKVKFKGTNKKQFYFPGLAKLVHFDSFKNINFFLLSFQLFDYLQYMQ